LNSSDLTGGVAHYRINDRIYNYDTPIGGAGNHSQKGMEGNIDRYGYSTFITGLWNGLFPGASPFA